MNQPLDALIVLGAGVRESRRRARYASKLDNGKIPIIVCGGRIKFMKHSTEAGQMRNELFEQGVDTSRIITEKESYSTLTNLEYAREIIDNLGAGKIGIVTGKAHMTRTRRLAKKILNECELEFYSVPMKNARDYVIEGISLFWEIMSSFNSHGLGYYLTR